MDKYSSIVSDGNFSTLSLKAASHPKTLLHWENLLNYLIGKASPLNKSLEPGIYDLIKGTYDSMLYNFPYLENYYIDYALFEYKLGNVSRARKIYEQGLRSFNERSLHLWISYLKLCNEVVSNHKQLFKLYHRAESLIGLHFMSGEFWEMYLDQICERCLTKERYFTVLRKVIEIPLHSFSKFYALWLHCIDDITDLTQLTRIAPKEELLKRLKIDTSFQGRKGPYLADAKKLLRKSTKELYMTVQHQVLEIYSLFESKLHINYYCSAETLISAEEIATWDSYLTYTINLRIDALTELNFQRALTCLAHYDCVWIKYAHWLIEYKEDLSSAKNVLLRALSLSHKKTAILKLLYSVLCKLKDHELLDFILEKEENIYATDVELTDDFELFWDFIQFRIFCANSRLQTRFETQSDELMPPKVFDIILTRLSHGESRKGQELLLSSLLQLQSKTNTAILETKIFKHIIEADWTFYLRSGHYWYLYCKLIFFEPTRTYLEKRRYIVDQIWEKAKKYGTAVVPKLRHFCQSYMPEDLDLLEDLFESS